MVVKTILGKKCQMTLNIPLGQTVEDHCVSPRSKKLDQNCSISQHFQDKCAFAFLQRNSKQLPEIEGKQFLAKSAR